MELHQALLPKFALLLITSDTAAETLVAMQRILIVKKFSHGVYTKPWGTFLNRLLQSISAAFRLGLEKKRDLLLPASNSEDRRAE